MKKRLIVIILVILLLGILFPFAALGQLFSGYAIVFNAIFNSLLSHILMHMVLFGGLVWIVMKLTANLPTKQFVLICLMSVLVVGAVQEIIQMVSVGVYDVGASLFDLGIDLAGGVIVLLVNWVSKTSRLKKRAPNHQV